ncbi:MAG TPA: septum formation initiator family protein [Chitinophagaceae bacterium]|nr:septum formation initiator family protein [Chitinophagaceae bacterium]
MRLLDHLPAWLKNKYFITIAAFAVWMLFFDDRDLFVTMVKQRRELAALQTSKSYYEQQITNTRKELDQLKINALTIEKYAREKYLMKRDNEDLFIVVPAREAK